MLIKHRKYVVSSIKNNYRYAGSTTKIIQHEELPSSAYQPAVVEKNKYSNWQDNKSFTAKNDKEKPIYSMVLPPPNVTGSLHLGHALACTIQDAIIRRKRSLGYNVMWLPGIDHAGIATQGVVEKYLKATYNKERNQMTRDEFIKEIWKWKEKYGDTICNQLSMLGCSLDWSRKLFTMDAKHSKSVDTAFIRLFKKGLIYRKKALVNWCNKLQSTVSDIEVENKLIDKPTDVFISSIQKKVKFGLLYDFAYKIEDSNEEIIVSTTMPETMLGDVAVAVHPLDPRYKHLHGKRVLHPFRKTKLPIICDDFVEMKFGTGAVKITPAHSKIDYEVAKQHELPLLQVINEKGYIESDTEFNKLHRYECRQILLEKLNYLGVLRKINSHQMTVPICSRTGDVIEHLPKEQWFLSCKKLNKVASEMVKNGNLKIEPEKFMKNWLQWTEDDRDWCISRQLWWGHQIPAYKCISDDKMMWIAAVDEKTAIEEASKSFKTSSKNITAERDLDVLDTWFSSGIYPFSSLGWPESTLDYEKFYPLNLLATGHDILGFWVHRMVILGQELTDKLPFNTVLLHGIICDSKGAKMSKSKGNVIDPVDVINGISMNELNKKSEDMYTKGLLSKDELLNAKSFQKTNFAKTNGIPECGVDALRFTLLSQDIKSHYINFDIDLCHTNKLFCNKMWQSIKYIQLSLEKLSEINENITINDLTYFDKWILSRLANMVNKVNTSMDLHDFHLTVRALKTLIYYEYCDVYLEATKPGFEDTDPKIGYAHSHTLIAVLNTALRCLAPIMIYITEELIPKVPAFEKNIIYNFNDSYKQHFDYPTNKEFAHWRNGKHEKEVENFLNVIFLVRQIKGFYTIPNKPRPKIYVKTNDESLIMNINSNVQVFKHLAKCGDIIFDNNTLDNSFVSGVLDKDTIISVQVVCDDINKLINTARNRLENNIKKAEVSLTKLEAKFLSNNYLTCVPESIQNIDKEKILNKKEEIKQLQRLIQL